ncbi:MAG: glycosyltransferase [Actinomycetota bacterium]|nr:glycosyltransferase [Actinomycetota bacterium]
MPSPPTVSVVVVNYNGREYLERCLGSLRELDHPADRIEVIFVDNASSDGSVDYVRQAFAECRVVVNDTNTGFSPAVNQGARLANGRYLALLNNDAVADRSWLREALVLLEADDRVGCVASKILREDRQRIDFAGAQMSFYGHGYAKHVEQVDAHEQGTRPTLFASGGALITPTELFLDAGGFDDSFFAFFEDVDYGWRLWVLGYEVVYVPTSKVYHRHHGTIERFGYARERYLLERNALATIFKNYGDDTLARTLPATILLTLGRGLNDLQRPLPDYRITEGATPIADDIALSPLAGAHLAALRDFGRDLELLRAKRKFVQDRRVTDDRVILRLFEETLRPNVNTPEFLQVFGNVLKAFDLEKQLRPESRVLIITQDIISPRMAGPAIRAWEMAKLLAREHHVTLGSTHDVQLSHPAFRTMKLHGGLVNALLDEVDVVIFQGFVMYEFPQIAGSGVPVLVDVYDPFHLENLEVRKEEPAVERFATAKSDVRVLNEQLQRGDFFVCASEKQRDFWLGQLSAVQRINPATYDRDESLRNLLDVAPFGLPAEPPRKTTDVLKGVVDGIGADDFLLLWGGGIYNWFDPLTLIRAVGEVAADHPDVKLFFMGSVHPNPGVPKMRMASAAWQLADDLGLLDKHVFFNPGWVEYERRADYLLEADVGVSTHFEHVETAFSYRTRILDYLWAGLPIVATEGDSLSRLTNQHGLGITVPPEDVAALVSAIRRLRNDRDLYGTCKANVEALAPQMTWERALAPVVDFCRRPRQAPDRGGKPYQYISTDQIVLNKSPAHYAKRVAHYYRQGGARVAALHVRNFVRRRLGR